MTVCCIQRGIRSLCWLALGFALYVASFFIFMATVCRGGIQLSATQLQMTHQTYRPVFKVLPSTTISKGLEICAGLSEIEAFFFFDEPQHVPLKTQ